MSTSQRVKTALIGCGGIAQAHWRGIQGHAPSIKVTAVVDTDAERAEKMADQTGAQAFTSLETALSDGDFTAVDIMLPHDQHEAVAVAAFAAAKHVVLEKPMAPTLDACARIQEAATAAATVFMVAEQSQYWPDALKVQELIRAGAIGEIITARAFFGGAVGGGWGSKPWRYELAKAGGGIVIDGGAHWIRPLRMWLGEIDEVVAVTGRPLEEMEGESLTRALMRFESGTVAVFDALRAGSFMGPGDEFRITGTMGELIVEKGHSGRLLRYDKAHPEGEVLADTKDEGRSASFGYELQDFALAVLEGKELEAGPDYSLGELRTALAIYRSAESKQWEKVWE
ncbi:MAG: UDP-N-acetyl-2-amino-2-deoxyglucuronate dehydrogenase [Planctomycetota bacterium]|jgi:UDP-N-acetyl-2-amino-2-deoxyglucuronate dehydrogenase